MIKLYLFESVDDALAFEHGPQHVKVTPGTVGTLFGFPIHADKTNPDPVATTTLKRHYNKKTKKADPEKEVVMERILKKAKSKRGGTRNCRICGQPGHNSKTCPKGQASKKADDLTQEQMDYIQELAEQGKTIAEIVIETGLPSKVVKENMY